jgi:Lon protease-like protein
MPRESLSLNVFEPRYLNLVDDVRAAGGCFGIVQIWPGGSLSRPRLAPIGTASRISSFHETSDGRYLIRATGLSRFALSEEFDRATPYRVAGVSYRGFEGDGAMRGQIADDRIRLTRLLQAWFQIEHIDADWSALASRPLVQLVDRLAMTAPFLSEERQALLEAPDGKARLLVMEDIIADRLAEHGRAPLP